MYCRDESKQARSEQKPNQIMPENRCYKSCRSPRRAPVTCIGFLCGQIPTRCQVCCQKFFCGIRICGSCVADSPIRCAVFLVRCCRCYPNSGSFQPCAPRGPSLGSGVNSNLASFTCPNRFPRGSADLHANTCIAGRRDSLIIQARVRILAFVRWFYVCMHAYAVDCHSHTSKIGVGDRPSVSSIFNYPTSDNPVMDADAKALGLSLIAMVGIVGLYLAFFT